MAVFLRPVEWIFVNTRILIDGGLLVIASSCHDIHCRMLGSDRGLVGIFYSIRKVELEGSSLIIRRLDGASQISFDGHKREYERSPR